MTIFDLGGNDTTLERDEFVQRVDDLKQSTWLELEQESGEVVRACLTWTNSATDVFLFTDRNGHKLTDRTRNGLIAEFRRGTARISEDLPLFDRAVNRLLDGLSKRADVA